MFWNLDLVFPLVEIFKQGLEQRSLNCDRSYESQPPLKIDNLTQYIDLELLSFYSLYKVNSS